MRTVENPLERVPCEEDGPSAACFDAERGLDGFGVGKALPQEPRTDVKLPSQNKHDWRVPLAQRVLYDFYDGEVIVKGFDVEQGGGVG